jgi:molybdopterin/thiamine biosynthesis adenylyltransferase
MLTAEQKAILERLFAQKNLRELSGKVADTIASQTDIPLRAVEWFALEKAVAPCRYRENLGSLGTAGQQRLLESRVIVVGLGGLGGHVVEGLARSGVGQIVGVDPDLFEETNLNRQLLANETNLGKKKVDETCRRLKKVNKAVEFTGYPVTLEDLPENAWEDADLVFDCLDNIENRLALANKCSMADVCLVHGAVAGWYGEIGLVWPGSGTLDRVYKNRKKRGIEKELGTVPFSVALTANLMLAAGVKVLVGKISEKKCQILFFDLLEDEWETMTL